MNEWRCHVEIELISDEQVEVRLFGSPDNGKYLSWKIPLSEAQDLASWWEEEVAPGTRRLPVKDLRHRSIQISMYSPTLVQIKGFDAYGSPRVVGWSLPTPVVEALVQYFAVPWKSSLPSTITSQHERRLRPRDPLEAAVPKESPITDRISVYFFGSDQDVLRKTATRDVTSLIENRKGDMPCCQVN
jgi:hypothetical protein